MSKPHLSVSEETWRRLNARKRPGDTFEDVLRRLLDGNEGGATDEIVAES